MPELHPIRFIDERITVRFDTPPAREKTPPCPDGFSWQRQDYRVVEALAEWSDFSRRGRMAGNMQPAHAAVAAGRGSLGVGRFYFRVRTNTGQVFDIYYDRKPKDANHSKGSWFVYRELEA
jgi:hypothetical protein